MKAGYYTGWLNLTGLVAILASVAYGAAIYLNTFIDLFSDSYAASFLGGNYLYQQFFWFAILMVVITSLNIFSSHLLAVINNVSVWWHVAGTAIVVLVLIFGPDSHQSLSFVFTERINNSGFGGGGKFWFYVLPLGFLLTQYTITGYDASAHLSEETRGGQRRGQGDLAVDPLLRDRRLDPAAGLPVRGHPRRLHQLVRPEGQPVRRRQRDRHPGHRAHPRDAQTGDLHQHVGPDLLLDRLHDLHLADALRVQPGRRGARIEALGQGQRERDAAQRRAARRRRGRRAHPAGPVQEPVRGSDRVLRRGLDRRARPLPGFAIPIWLRWKAGDVPEAGPWTLGGKYKWMSLLAVGEIVITSIYFILPFAPTGVPFAKDFTWTVVNYAPIVMVVLMVGLWVGWHTSAKHWFTGPRITLGHPAGRGSPRSSSGTAPVGFLTPRQPCPACLRSRFSPEIGTRISHSAAVLGR